jgi:hypothetical protein
VIWIKTALTKTLATIITAVITVENRVVIPIIMEGVIATNFDTPIDFLRIFTVL